MKMTCRLNPSWVRYVGAAVAAAVLPVLALDSGPPPLRALSQRKAPKKSEVKSEVVPRPTSTATPDLINGNFEDRGDCDKEGQDCTTAPADYNCIPDHGAALYTLTDMPDIDDGKCKLPGWGYDYCVDYIYNTPDCYNSDRCVDLGGGSGGGCGGCASIQQDVRLVRGETYCLSFYMAGNYYGGPEVKRMKVVAGAVSAVFEYDTCCIDATDDGSDPDGIPVGKLTSDKWICRQVEFKPAGLPDRTDRTKVITRIKFTNDGGGESGCKECTPGDEPPEDEVTGKECSYNKSGSGCSGFGPLLDNVVLVLGKCPTEGKCVAPATPQCEKCPEWLCAGESRLLVPGVKGVISAGPNIE